MKIGAYQFAVTGNIDKNTECSLMAMNQALEQKVRLLVFPECALTGYPPYDIGSSSCIDVDKVMNSLKTIQRAADQMDIYVVVGAIVKENGFHNSAVIISPNCPMQVYHKRALFGWDAENFVSSHKPGVFAVDGFKIGVRICFEVRFPEYFRE